MEAVNELLSGVAGYVTVALIRNLNGVNNIRRKITSKCDVLQGKSDACL